MLSIFIFAHGCRLNETFSLGQNMILMFKSIENTCAVADATSLDTDPSNYKHRVVQIDPSNKPYDYELSFQDDLQDFGLNTFGIFMYNTNNELIRIIDNPSEDIRLSAIINILKKYSKNFTLYLNVCRNPCGGRGGKKKVVKRNKSNKNKRNKNKRNKNKNITQKR